MKQFIQLFGLTLSIVCSAVAATAEDLQSPLTRSERPPLCGDGVCGAGEDKINCPEDCRDSGLLLCGNGMCEEGENEVNCIEDCGPIGEPDPMCGDDKCNGYEDKFSCARDCSDHRVRESSCQAVFQFVIVEQRVALPWNPKGEDSNPCPLVEAHCASDPEFLMSVSCTTYAELCEDTEIMCE